jgi:hypothetical protein
MSKEQNSPDSALLAKALALVIDDFVVALKVGDTIRIGRWKANDLPANMWFGGKSGCKIRIPHYQISNQELKAWAQRMVYSIIQIVAIAGHEALKRKFPGEPYDDPDMERRAVRCIMYMIRCAYAHDPIQPVWECKNHYRQTFAIPSLDIMLGCANLNGKRVDPSHFGEWHKLKLLADRCLELVS